MEPAQNITIPPGWTDHGQEGLICKPADFVSIATFFLVNYIAHLFSLKWYPAETTKERVIAMIAALFYPGFGLMRAVDHIQRAWTGRSNSSRRTALGRAHNAEALCMVIRSWNWSPEVGDKIAFTKAILSKKNREANHETENPNTANVDVESGVNDCLVRDSGQVEMDSLTLTQYEVCKPPWYKLDAATSRLNDTVQNRHCHIHGSYRLPKGYELAYVPRSATLNQHSDFSIKSQISCSDSWANALISIYQICASSVTIYRARGDQIDRYGYSAFGLTVIPYILMTVINLISRIVESDYPALYMVRGPEMDEAELRGGYFEGTVGELEPLSEQSVHKIFCSDLKTLEIIDIVSGSRHEFTIRIEEMSLRMQDDAGNERGGSIYIPCCSLFATKLGTELNYWSSTYRDKSPGKSMTYRMFLIPVALVVAVVALYGGLSGFRSGSETTAIQKGFIMSWIILGSYGGWGGPVFNAYVGVVRWLIKNETRDEELWLRIALWVIFLAFAFTPIVVLTAFFVPAIGGMVMVGLMIKDFGQCTRI